MATRQQLIEATYVQLWEPSDSSNYTIDRVSQVLNSYINRICKKVVINPANWQKYQWWDLAFLQRQSWYTNLQVISLWDTLETTDVVATLDTTSLASSGAVMIGGDIVSYTGKTATTLTGVSWVDVEHTSWSSVYPLFTLPTGITRPFKMYVVSDDGRKQEIPAVDDRYPSGTSRNFSIVVDNDGTEYLLFNGISSSDKVVLYYYETPDDLVNADDVCVIPDPYAMDILPRVVAWQLFWDTEEYEDAQSKLWAWFSALQEMYDFYISRVEKWRPQVQVRQSDFRSVTGFYGKRHRNSIR